MNVKLTAAAFAAACSLGGIASAQTEGMDLDGDGRITVEELIAYGRDNPEIEGYWSIYDYDLSGGITAEEYARAELGLWEPQDEAPVEPGGLDTDEAVPAGGDADDGAGFDFAAIDADGNGEVSREEFVRSGFSRFDTDGNGALDADEMSRMIEKTMPR